MHEEFAAQLDDRLRQVEERLAHLAADEASVREDRSDATADDEHDPEGSTLSAEWSRLDALRRDALGERDEIRRALDRLRDGTYGTCERCGRRIPVGRLRARPMATRCVDCAALAG